MFYEEPSWISNDRLLLFDSLNGGVPQVVAGGVGTNHNDLTGWFHDLDTFQEPGGWHPVGAGELSRTGTRLAALRAGGTMGAGYEARGRFNSIQLYNVTGLDAKPQPTCALRDDQGAEFATPTWSPGGDALAWATPAGIYSTPLGPNCEGFVERLVVPGGREPDWGPADPGAAPAAQPPTTQQPATQTPAAPKITRVKVRGRKVTVKLNCSCAATVVARKGKRVVGRGKGTGQVTVRIRAHGKVRLTVTVGATTLTKTVKLR
jgi:hypothetical protein